MEKKMLRRYSHPRCTLPNQPAPSTSHLHKLHGIVSPSFPVPGASSSVQQKPQPLLLLLLPANFSLLPFSAGKVVGCGALLCDNGAAAAALCCRR